MNDPLRAQQMVRRQVRRRRRWRRLRLAVLVLVSTTAVVGAAVGIDRLAVVVHKFYTDHHHAARRATGPTTHATTTTVTTIPGPPRCASPQLGAAVSDWRETGGTVEETVSLTNISPTPCTLVGYPVLGATAQGGTPLPATTDDDPTIGPPSTALTTAPATGAVALIHGARASFELSYPNVCDHVVLPGAAATGVPNECYSGIWLDVTPTPGSSPLVVTEPLRLTYATSGFEVGPFQAGNGTPLPGPPPTNATTTVPPSPPTTG
jgi:hypothetical protein